MHRDFLTALWNSEPVQKVYDRLAAEADEAWHKEKAALWRDMKICEDINAALHESVDSVPYKWAMAYMEEAKKREQEKTPAQRNYEKHRREIEAEYLDLKEKEIEELRKHFHSEK